MKNNVFTVDSHIMGEPLRIITGGVPFLKGNSINEKKQYFEKNFDHIRSSIILEPRGHDDMFGAILCEPVNPIADIGIFFMHSGGYLNMCGHGTIGAVTTILEMGIIDKKIQDRTEVILETPAGLVYAYAVVQNGKVDSVSFENVPSFVLYKDLKITFSEIGDITLDIGFGGSFFGIVSAEKLNLKIEKNNISGIISHGMKLRKIINDTVKIYHPINENINKVDLIEIYETKEDNKLCHKNCVVFGNGQVDRSPCGTGTSAMLAVKYQNKEIKLNEDFYNQSIIGTTFIGKATKETKVGSYDAIVPVIQGKAFITGTHHFIIDSNDFLHKGITLRNI